MGECRQAIDNDDLNECFERLNRARDILTQGAQSLKNGPVMEASFAKQYYDGLLDIACVFNRAVTRKHGLGWVGQNEARSVFPNDTAGATCKRDFCSCLKSELSVSGQEQMVLISNVKSVKVVKVKRAPSIGLHIIDDKVDNILMGKSGFGLSVDGAFHRWPVRAKMELNSIGELATIGFNENPIRVIETDSQIMNDISNHSRGVFRELGDEIYGQVLLSTLVYLSSHGFSVSSYVSPQNCFELNHVIIGPFYF